MAQRVAEWARRIIAHCDAMRDELAAMHDDLKGKLRMGAMPSVSPVLPLLVTIIPGHFTRMPGLHPGTKALDLVDPVVSQEVGLVWTAGEPMMPMARVMVSIVEDLKRSGELEKRLGEFAVTEQRASAAE